MTAENRVKALKGPTKSKSLSCDTAIRAIYTVRTNRDGTLRGWSNKEAALNFLTHSVYSSKHIFTKVVLYTDSYGRYLLKDVGFDEIYVTLDKFDIGRGLRSACKLNTYSHQNSPFIHLDWDFILWKLPTELLKSSILAQSRLVDDGGSRISLVLRSLKWKPAFIEDILEGGISVDLPCPSLMGGLDVDFLRWYSELALEILRHPKNQFLHQLIDGEAAEDISVAIEQWFLGACALEKGVTIRYLSDQPTSQIDAVDPKHIVQLGFTHLAGRSKLSNYWIREISERNRKAGLTTVFKAAGRSPQSDGHAIDLKAIPYSVLLSTERQHERRSLAQKQLKKLGIVAEWKKPVKIEDIKWNASTEAYKERPASASHALTLIEVLDEAERRKVEYAMLFEDDVMFHSDILEVVNEVKVPNDWKFIYLGGRNCGTKQQVSSRLVRSTFISDLHAVILHSDMFSLVKQVLMDPCIHSIWLDFRIATLHDRYPAYMFRPNLAWQSEHSDDSGVREPYSNYHPTGEVKHGQGD
jgi:hypothetical protein